MALPEREEDCEPSFEVIRAADVLVTEAPGLRVRRLLGAGVRPHAPGAAWLSDVELAAGAAYEAPPGAEGALHVLEGALEIEGRTLDAGDTATFGDGDARRFVARGRARAIGFGGDALGPRYLWWNYVHSSRERIEEAKAQWLQKRFALPADDSGRRHPAAGGPRAAAGGAQRALTSRRSTAPVSHPGADESRGAVVGEDASRPVHSSD